MIQQATKGGLPKPLWYDGDDIMGIQFGIFDLPYSWHWLQFLCLPIIFQLSECIAEPLRIDRKEIPQMFLGLQGGVFSLHFF